jgi:hypothetical protein
MRHDTTAALTLKTLRHTVRTKPARERSHRTLLHKIQKAFDKSAFLASLEKQRRDAWRAKCASHARKNAPCGL